ncbi:hypothetical protein BS78_K306000 [Paspalum vaginatum]|uniref:Uncharacterized protein n=1 Tax=Paspalum vaginatum TaxID=158149 RepID=A0A9W8CEM3_9POAL|nr:hypothetical protein BS78_K306000 [Paspalum vaginatum]
MPLAPPGRLSASTAVLPFGCPAPAPWLPLHSGHLPPCARSPVPAGRLPASAPRLPLHLRGQRIGISISAPASPSPPPLPENEAVAEVVPVPTVESCVKLGLDLFSKGRVGSPSPTRTTDPATRNLVVRLVVD